MFYKRVFFMYNGNSKIAERNSKFIFKTSAMAEKKINRRGFLKKATVTGLSSVYICSENKADTKEPKDREQKKIKKNKLPTRKLGKTGIEVPVLVLGVPFDATEKQIVLRKGYNLGLYLWDTAHRYTNGNSELGIGEFIKRNPDVRKKLVLVTKASWAKNADEYEQRLQTSLKRMNTNYIDIFYGIHGMYDPAELTKELKTWAQSAKNRNLIKHFGFSTHSNMSNCLMAAAKTDWIDVIMTKYNFREMQSEKMNKAIEACHKAGIGLIAMKVQARGAALEKKEDKKLTEHFLKRGFTEGQAKIKAVLEDKRISSACAGRGDIGHLILNVAAVQNKTKLTKADRHILKEYTAQTCSGYCAGCSQICDSALPGTAGISDIMRYLMYYNNYDEKKEARKLFSQIPLEIRNRIPKTDYTAAENLCPQHLPIAKLMAEAVTKLTG
jgi:predicted aldo/keto reductase-like oxidoreductase